MWPNTVTKIKDNNGSKEVDKDMFAKTRRWLTYDNNRFVFYIITKRV